MKSSQLFTVALVLGLLVGQSLAQSTFSFTNAGLLGTAAGLGALYYLYNQNNQVPPIPPIFPPPVHFGPAWGPNPFWRPRPRYPPPPPPPFFGFPYRG